MLGDAASPNPFQALGLDIDLMLAPLPTGDGGGDDLRYTPEFDKIADARRDEDDSSQGIWQTEAKKADWPVVVRMGAELLATRSKDLQVAVWMTEALINLHGLRGAAAGLDLVAGLTEGFWATLWPRIEDGDLESRLSPFYWMDSHLAMALVRLPIAEPVQGERTALGYYHVVKARKLQQLASNNPKAYQDAISEGEVPIEAIDRAIVSSSDGFFEAQAAASGLALEALARLTRALDSAIGRDAPSFTNLRRTLEEIDRLHVHTLTARGRQMAPAAAAQTKQRDEPKEKQARSRQDGNKMERDKTDPNGLPTITSRRGAYALLDHAANWLLRFEPHSPAPYLVKRAVAWEEKTLRDVLAELMSRGADRDVIFEMLGMDGEGRAATPRGRRHSSISEE